MTEQIGFIIKIMIKKFIQSLALDKKEHIIVGIIYSLMIVAGGLILGSLGALIGFIIGTLLNLWKELWNDWRNGKGKAEFWDFVATETPLLIVYIAYLI